MSEPDVCFKDVSLDFGNVSVLKNVNFDIEHGEIVSLLGPNGGGKTTILKLILGLIRPTRGSITVFGSTPESARRSVGYMPQHMRYDPHFPVSVLDVVLMGRVDRHRFGSYKSSERHAALNALSETGVEELAKRPFSDLSGGQRQRVLIARALFSEPELLLLDEPTANVDLLAESQFLEILRRLNERMTVVIVSHDLGFVSDVVGKVICVHGHVVVHPTSVVTGEIIQDVYGGDIRMVRHDHSCPDAEHAHE
jgi:zinc transport system ATP-binding protein